MNFLSGGHNNGQLSIKLVKQQLESFAFDCWDIIATANLVAATESINAQTWANVQFK